jgi:ATP-dependent helicase/nuclease subunit B
VTSAHPAIFTIPAHRAFADALAAGLIAQFGQDRLGLARGIVLLPNNRAITALRDAFVRRSDGGLLLPRLVAVGDPELDERLGSLLDPLDDEDIPPAVDPLRRLLILARMIAAESGVGAGEAMRLATDLARVLDQLLVEEVDPQRLRQILDPAIEPMLSQHWQASLDRLETILSRWPAELARLGRIDLAGRRGRLLNRAARRWAERPPAGFVIAAGITTSAPAVARLLRTIVFLPDGMVVLPALDLGMAEQDWRALGPHDPDPETGRARPAIETHPQFHLKLLLDRMGVARGEVRGWRWGGGRDAAAARARAIGHAMAPAAATGRWQALPPRERRLSGVRALELATPAEEAQAIAIAMREALETPGRTAALVTPDRNLARRVAAHLHRWGIAADDSAGRPLSVTPPGAFLIGLAQAAAEGFAPVPLLSTLKHPLVRRGEARLEWLEHVRAVDLALRGPRPAGGLAGMTAHLEGNDWWRATADLLAPLETGFAIGKPATMLAALRDVAGALCGDALWSGTDGRAAAELFAGLIDAAEDGPAMATPDDLVRMLRQLMDAIAIRPPQGGHPRIAIWGLLEARLQRTDLMILGGLNEGTWPAAPAPDAWLAPRIRADLGLPGVDRRIGLAAHDLATAIGAPQVIVTRARRDARAPAIASRFWLRLEAMTGGLTRAPAYRKWTRLIDAPGEHAPADRPAPVPPLADRPSRIAVTRLDRLRADPFAFYADAMLRLRRIDPVDADPSPAWRGSAVHRVFEEWMTRDGCDPAKLRLRAEAMLATIAAHPVLRALWTPRLIEAIDWAAATMAEDVAEGRTSLVAERKGEAEVAGVILYGTVDRIDRQADDTLAIVDYKTGKPPATAQVMAGYAMQLGLLGLIAEHGGFADVSGVARLFEYWSLGSEKNQLGYRRNPLLVRGKPVIDPADFTAHALHHLEDAVDRWLKGTEPFTAKLVPEYSPYGDYDQLMRLDEWYGRE